MSVGTSEPSILLRSTPEVNEVLGDERFCSIIGYKIETGNFILILLPILLRN